MVEAQFSLVWTVAGRTTRVGQPD